MKIIVQNLAIKYEDKGDGSIVLFLHGWQDNLHTFDSLISFLSLKEKRIVRLDLPGFGESEMPKEIWNLDNYIQFVADFIKELNIEVDILIGHSFGGRIIIKGIAEKKIKARKIILISSAGLIRGRALRNLIFKILAKIMGLIMYLPPFIFWREKLRKKAYNLIGSDYFNAGPLKETFLKIIAEDLSKNAKNITIPTLLIWGANDTETPINDGKKFSQLIRGAELKIINNAGHFIHQEQPQEVANIIKKFL